MSIGGDAYSLEVELRYNGDPNIVRPIIIQISS